MAVTQGSTLYGGSVSKAAIYEIMNGEGFTWAPHVRTELNVDGKPRQLTRAKRSANPIRENVTNPRRPTDFPTTDTVVFDGRLLNVTPLMLTDTMTVTDFLDTFPDYQPSGLSVDLKNNPKIMKVVFNLILNAAQTQLNELHAVGDDTLIAPDPLRFYNGFVTEILADADATQVGVPAVLTEANILSYVFELRNAIDPRLRNKKSLKIFSSYADADLFDVAGRNTQDSTIITTVRNGLEIKQANGSVINIIPNEGIPKDFMFATIADKTPASNLVQGVWMDRDSDTLKMYKEVEADQTWNIIMRLYTGTQYVDGGDIWYLNNV